MTAPKVQQSAKQMCQRFNEGRYYERMLDENDEGVLLGDIEDIGPALKDHPKHIRSQIVKYEDRFGTTIVIAHQYGNKHGEAVEGMLPDPKFLYEGGVRYRHDAGLDLLEVLDKD